MNTNNTAAKPKGQITIYQTTKRVENPHGDGRHNRAGWRSQLEKTSIQPGFLFGVDEGGTVYDFNEAKFALKAKDLRDSLLAVASAPLRVEIVPDEETMESVLKTIPGGAMEAMNAIMETLNLAPKDLRALIQDQRKAAAAASEKAESHDAIDITAEL